MEAANNSANGKQYRKQWRSAGSGLSGEQFPVSATSWVIGRACEVPTLHFDGSRRGKGISAQEKSGAA
jgi:hypothetical protein